MKTEKEILQEELEKKESQLVRASSEANAWSKGKYKNSSKATMAKLLEESFKKEVANLHKQLAEIDKNT